MKQARSYWTYDPIRRESAYWVDGVQKAGYNHQADEYREYDAATETWSEPLTPPWRKRR